MTDVTTMLAGIRERAEAATEGPWHVDRDEPGEVGSVVAYQNQDGITIGSYIADIVEEDANATFIAAARTDVPRLVAALEAILALADESDIHDQDYGERLASGHVSTDDLRTAVVAALGGGE